MVAVEEPDDRVDQVGLDIRKNCISLPSGNSATIGWLFCGDNESRAGCYDEKARVTAGKSMYVHVVVTKTLSGLKSWG